MERYKNNIKALRSSKNMPQVELADRVGVHRETITRIENGYKLPSVKLAIDIAKVFDKSVEEVFFFEG